MCGQIPNSRLLPKTANNLDVMTFDAASKRWVAMAGGGGGAFDPTANQSISGNYSFSKPIQLAQFAGVPDAPDFGHSIYTATSMIESRFFKANGFRHHFDFSALTSSRTILIPDAGGTMVTTSLLGGYLKLGAPLDATLRSVTDYAGTVSPLQLSNTLVQAGKVVFNNGILTRDVEDATGLKIFGGNTSDVGASGYMEFQRSGYYWGAPIFGLANVASPLNRFIWKRSGFEIAELTSEGLFRINQPTGVGLEILRSAATGQKVILGANNGTVDAFIAGGGNNKPFQIANVGAFPIGFSANGLATGVPLYQMALTAQGNLVVGSDPLANTSLARTTIRGNGTEAILRTEDVSGNAVGVLVYNSRLDIYGRNYSNSEYLVNVYNGLSWGATTGTVGYMNFANATFSAGAGGANFRPINIAYSINNSGVQTGTATGFFLNATEAALNGMTHNLMDLNVANASRASISNGGWLRLSSFMSISNQQVNFTSYANGQLTLFDSTFGNFTRVNLGGTSNLFPSIKRVGSAIHIRTADDSAYAQLNTGYLIANGLMFSGNTGYDIRSSLANHSLNFNTSTVVLAENWSVSNYASALFAIDSTTRGFLTPRLTTVQQDGIGTPATGLMLFNTTLNQLAIFSSTWHQVITNKSNLDVGSDYEIRFSNTIGSPFAVKDLGIKRLSAGVMQITDGSTGCGGLKACYIHTADLSGGGLSTARPFRIGAIGEITQLEFTSIGLDNQIAVEHNGTILYIPASSIQIT